MSRVTSKLQVTIPKTIADRYGIEPGGEIEWLPAGDAIRVVPQTTRSNAHDRARRLELFDRATERQRERQAGKHSSEPSADRGWTRGDLYGRGSPR